MGSEAITLLNPGIDHEGGDPEPGGPEPDLADHRVL